MPAELLRPDDGSMRCRLAWSCEAGRKLTGFNLEKPTEELGARPKLAGDWEESRVCGGPRMNHWGCLKPEIQALLFRLIELVAPGHVTLPRLCF